MPSDSRTRTAPVPAADPVALDDARLDTSQDGVVLPDEPEARSRLARIGRALPRLSALVRFANRVALLSAICAGALWWSLAGGSFALGAAAWIPALGGLVLLLIPAGAAWLLGLTLKDLAAIPAGLRATATAAAADARGALGTKKEGRIVGMVRALWAARGLVLESKGAWAKAATAFRVVRLAKLPFALGLLGLFLLNGLVILAGGIAAVLLLF